MKNGRCIVASTSGTRHRKRSSLSSRRTELDLDRISCKKDLVAFWTGRPRAANALSVGFEKQKVGQFDTATVKEDMYLSQSGVIKTTRTMCLEDTRFYEGGEI